MHFSTQTRRTLILPLVVMALVPLACSSPGVDPTPTAEGPTNALNGATDSVDLPTAGSEDASSQSGTLGQDIPIAGALHIDESEIPSDWNSDPPTSGQHYARWVPAGFYEEPIPDGFLVHNMEHGYVVVYYDCSGMEDSSCNQYKSDIEAALAAAGLDSETNTLKVVVVPRTSMGNPITYASWGHLYKAQEFVADELVAYIRFYRSNQQYAPEWNLP